MKSQFEPVLTIDEGSLTVLGPFDQGPGDPLELPTHYLSWRIDQGEHALQHDPGVGQRLARPGAAARGLGGGACVRAGDRRLPHPDRSAVVQLVKRGRAAARLTTRGVSARVGDSSRAARSPPRPPNRWPCQEIPSCGTRPDSSVVPQITATTTPTPRCSSDR